MESVRLQIVLAPSRNVIVPVAVTPEVGCTVAVSVINCPHSVGFALEVTVVVVLPEPTTVPPKGTTVLDPFVLFTVKLPATAPGGEPEGGTKTTL